MNFNLSSVGISIGSFWRPSLAPTSTIFTLGGKFPRSYSIIFHPISFYLGSIPSRNQRKSPKWTPTRALFRPSIPQTRSKQLHLQFQNKMWRSKKIPEGRYGNLWYVLTLRMICRGMGNLARNWTFLPRSDLR